MIFCVVTHFSQIQQKTEGTISIDLFALITIVTWWGWNTCIYIYRGDEHISVYIILLWLLSRILGFDWGLVINVFTNECTELAPLKVLYNFIELKQKLNHGRFICHYREMSLSLPCLLKANQWYELFTLDKNKTNWQVTPRNRTYHNILVFPKWIWQIRQIS